MRLDMHRGCACHVHGNANGNSLQQRREQRIQIGVGTKGWRALERQWMRPERIGCEWRRRMCTCTCVFVCVCVCGCRWPRREACVAGRSPLPQPCPGANDLRRSRICVGMCVSVFVCTPFRLRGTCASVFMCMQVLRCSTSLRRIRVLGLALVDDTPRDASELRLDRIDIDALDRTRVRQEHGRSAASVSLVCELKQWRQPRL